MNQKRTQGIILQRVDFGEADRIITVLTPDDGKLSLMAKGVRKVKSKLAGGIELFSTSELTYIPGRGSVSTLVSTRLIKYYSHIVQDVDRTMLGYDLLQLLHKVTEDSPEPAYYHLLEEAFIALDTNTVPLELTRAWFYAQLLALAGHTPNLQTTPGGQKLSAGERYGFDFEATAMIQRDGGAFGVDEIKLLRLLFGQHSAQPLAKVSGVDVLAGQCLPLVTTLRQLHLRV